MKKCNKIILFAFVLIVAGCVGAPLKKSAILAGSKIGIFVDEMPNEMTHVHVGTTWLNLFNKQYPLSVDIRKYIAERAFSALSSRGYEPVLLELNASERTAIKSATKINEWSGSLEISPTGLATLSSLRDKYGVNLIVSYSSHKSKVFTPSLNAYQAGNYGLFSDSMLNMDMFHVYSFISVQALSTAPPNVNATGGYYDSPILENFPEPEDLHNIPASSMDLVEKAILKRFNDFVEASVSNSVSNGEPKKLEGANLQ